MIEIYSISCKLFNPFGRGKYFLVERKNLEIFHLQKAKRERIRKREKIYIDIKIDTWKKKEKRENE